MPEIYVPECRKSWCWKLKIRSRWWIITDLFIVCLCNLFTTCFHFLTLCQAAFWNGSWLLIIFQVSEANEDIFLIVQSSSWPEDGKHLRLAQQASYCNAGSTASVPFCVMTDAGSGLRRGTVERNIFHGLLHWVWAKCFSKVATPCVNWDLAADHHSISPSVSFPCWLNCDDQNVRVKSWLLRLATVFWG